MYRIIKQDGTELAVTEKVNYIKIAGNGCYVLAEKADAGGVSVNGTPYSILLHDPIEGAADTVIISEFDEGQELSQHSHQIDLLEEVAIQLEKIAIEHGDLSIDDVPEEWQDAFAGDSNIPFTPDGTDIDGSDDGSGDTTLDTPIQ